MEDAADHLRSGRQVRFLPTQRVNLIDQLLLDPQSDRMRVFLGWSHFPDIMMLTLQCHDAILGRREQECQLLLPP